MLLEATLGLQQVDPSQVLNPGKGGVKVTRGGQQVAIIQPHLPSRKCDLVPFLSIYIISKAPLV